MPTPSATNYTTTELYGSAHLKVFLLHEPQFQVDSTEGLKPVPLRSFVQALTHDFTVTYPAFELMVDISGLNVVDFSFSETEQKISTKTTIPRGTAIAKPPTWDTAKPVEGIAMKRISQPTQKDATLNFRVTGVGKYTLKLVDNPKPDGDHRKQVILVTSQTR